LIFVAISIIIGLKITAKYFKFKKQEFLLLGLFWIGLTTPWWPNVITFTLILLFNAPVNIKNFVIIGIALLPPTIICGLYSFTKLLIMDDRNRKLILAIIGIPNIIIEVLFIYFLFVF